MAFSFIILTPLALRTEWEVHKKTLTKQWTGIAYIGCFMALNIALNNISLLDISLSLNQVIRSSIPVITCILAIPVENKLPTRREFLSLVVLTVGVMIAVWQGSISGKPVAILFCILSTVCNGAMMTFSGKVLSEKLDVVRLTFYTAPVSLACLLPFMVWREIGKFRPFLGAQFYGVIGVILVSSLNAVCYNAIHALVIKWTSAVTTTVIGEVKIVALLLLSAFLLDEGKEFTLRMLIGCGLAISGFIMYSHVKLAAMKSSLSLPTILPIDTAEDVPLINEMAPLPPKTTSSPK